MQAVSTSREPPACFLQSNMHWRLNTGGPRSRRRAFILCARAGLSMGEAWRKPARAYRLILPAALFYTKKETIAQRQSLQTVEKVLCRGAQCAPVLVSCMSSFLGNALPRQVSGRTMFAPTVSTIGKMVFWQTGLPLGGGHWVAAPKRLPLRGAPAQRVRGGYFSYRPTK